MQASYIYSIVNNELQFSGLKHVHFMHCTALF